VTSVLSFGRLHPPAGASRREQARTAVRDARHDLRAELMSISESIYRSLFRRNTVIVYKFISTIAAGSFYHELRRSRKSSLPSFAAGANRRSWVDTK
jgi:hypothetical protein